MFDHELLVDLGRLALAAAIGLAAAYLLVRTSTEAGQVRGYALARKYFESKMPRLMQRGADVWIDDQPLEGVQSVWVQSHLGTGVQQLTPIDDD